MRYRIFLIAIKIVAGSGARADPFYSFVAVHDVVRSSLHPESYCVKRMKLNGQTLLKALLVYDLLRLETARDFGDRCSITNYLPPWCCPRVRLSSGKGITVERIHLTIDPVACALLAKTRFGTL